MKIYISSDHTGFSIKEKITAYLGETDHKVEDMGAFELDPTDDYPDYVRPVARSVASDLGSFGFIFGGSGQGEAMCANRERGVRAAVFYGKVVAQGAIDIEGKKSEDPFEIIKLARIHNNANILAVSTRFLDEEDIKKAVQLFLDTDFQDEERHMRRIRKIDEINHE